MNVVVLGASGQLGVDICKTFEDEHLITPTHQDLDISNLSGVNAFLENNHPEIVINCVAYHDVAGCELNSELAYLLNFQAVKNLSIACNNVGAKFVHISTDYVFDGYKGNYNENSLTNPLNVYGKSKISGENIITRNSQDYIIGRVSSLFGLKGSSNKGLNFVEKVINFKGDSMKIVSDQVMSPTYTMDAATLIRGLVNDDYKGIAHLNNEGACSWYEFASEIIHLCDLNIKLEPITLDLITSIVQTPKNSSMKSLHIKNRSWREALHEYIKLRSNQ